jgi:hypothetical protein
MTDEQHRRMEEELAESAAWDRRYDPPEPQWTTVKPTQLGFYWHRLNPEQNPEVVRVWRTTIAGHKRVNCSWGQVNLEALPGEWSGPLHPPEDKK